MEVKKIHGLAMGLTIIASLGSISLIHKNPEFADNAYIKWQEATRSDLDLAWEEAAIHSGTYRIDGKTWVDPRSESHQKQCMLGPSIEPGDFETRYHAYFDGKISEEEMAKITSTYANVFPKEQEMYFAKENQVLTDEQIAAINGWTLLEDSESSKVK